MALDRVKIRFGSILRNAPHAPRFAVFAVRQIGLYNFPDFRFRNPRKPVYIRHSDQILPFDFKRHALFSSREIILPIRR